MPNRSGADWQPARRLPPANLPHKWGLIAILALAPFAAAQPLDLSLKSAVDLALKQNPRIQIAALQALETASQEGVVRSALRPQVNAGFGSAYATTNFQALGLNLPGMPDRAGPFQQFDARPSISQTLFDPGLRKSIAAAGERTREARWSGVALRESVVLSVVQAYLDVLESEARLASANAGLDTAESLLHQTRDLVEGGAASRLDQARATLQVENQRRAVFEARRQRDTRRLLLANALGIDAGRPLHLSDRLLPPSTQPLIDVDAPALALQNRPEMRAVEARLRAAVADRDKARAERYPTIGMAADFGRLGNSFANNVSTYSARLVVHIPILEGGRIEAEVAAANARMKQAEEELRETRLRVEMEVQSARIAMEAASQASEASSRASESARTVLELARARFEGGFSTNIEVVSAQEALTAAQSAEIGCLYDWYLARARLAKAQGDILALFP